MARDPRILFLVTISPAFLLFTLAYVFAFDVDRVVVGVVDQDQSSLSRGYLSALASDGKVEVAARASGPQDLHSLLVEERVQAILVIPPGFSEGILRGDPQVVQAIVDGADPIAASQAMANLGGRTAAFQNALRSQGAPGQGAIMEIESRARYNPGLKSLVSVVPGLFAVVLCMPALAVALSLTREKERGTFEGLISTPIRAPEYLIGKLLPYLLGSLVSALLAWLLAILWFRVPFRGDLGSFILASAIYLLATMGISVLVATFVHSQQTAMFAVLMIFFVPTFFLSGLILPVNAGSAASAAASYSLPGTHYVEVGRAICLKGLGIAEVWAPVLTLAAMGGASVALSVLFTRMRLD